jgi:hypothetical protein
MLSIDTEDYTYSQVSKDLIALVNDVSKRGESSRVPSVPCIIHELILHVYLNHNVIFH